MDTATDPLIGKRFGRLVVVGLSSIDNHRHKKYECKCDCGNTSFVFGTSLKSGDTKSCGCILRIHNLSKSPIYKVWKTMIQRCENRNNHKYPNYGGRGISVCDRWHSFENFYEDMGDPPEGMSIDRIDNDGNYTPSNCRWATSKEQANHTRRNRMIEYQGENKPLQQWADEFGVKRELIARRLNRGWAIREALTKPSRVRP